MNEPVFIYVLLVGLSILGIIKNSISFNPIYFHCDNYILSTYLYFILSWAIALSTVTGLSYYNVTLQKLFTKPFTILLFISSLLLMVGLMIIPMKMFFTKHLIYIAEIVLLGITLYPLYLRSREKFNHVGLTTLSVLVVLSILAYMKPNLIDDNIIVYLVIGLLALLFGRLVEVFLLDQKDPKTQKYSRIISYISILLFSLFIMYDTKSIIRNAKNCKVSAFGPDYINESINLFLDSLNLFSSTYHVQHD
jgi:FtsH-binding integral membrane protein